MLPLMFAMFGIACLIFGFYLLRKKRIINETPFSNIRSLAMGLVKLKGKALPFQDDTLINPLTGKQCLFYRFNIDKYAPGGGPDWIPVSLDFKQVKFQVQDETGTVLVDPKGAVVEAPIVFLETKHKEEIPDYVRKFLTAHNIRIDDRMKIEEHCIFSGDNIFIIGTADDNPFVEEATGTENTQDIMIRKGTNEKTFHVSTNEMHIVGKGLSRSGIALLGIGSVLMIIALIVVLKDSGML